jgi:hypothetical protein
MKDDLEEYLITRELSDRIKRSPGTIRNMVCRGQLKLGIHYVKPGNGRLLFLWSAIEDWLHAGPASKTSASQKRRLINI